MPNDRPRCTTCDAELSPQARFCASCGARVETPPAAPADPLLETLRRAIGFQYDVQRLLGRGGMGAVYLAHERALDRDVAIKVLPPEMASSAGLLERFKREARTAARLSHPNIVPLHTFGEVSGLVYFVMGYVEGESLAERLRRDGPLDPGTARSLLSSLCDALAYAHGQGVIHRDIKPDNILLARSGAPLLTDFGIARPALGEAQLTATGQLIGTPHYMSPEQAVGRADLDARSDLYSLGVMAYEMIAGVRPFEAEHPMDALTRRLTHDPKPLALVAPGAPPDLAMAVDRCLQREASKRWPDAATLREALLPVEEGTEDPHLVRVARIMLTVVVPILLLALGYVSLVGTWHRDSPVVGRMSGMVGGMLVGAMLVSAVILLRLRVEGIDWRSLAFKMFQQPTWWRSWYPRAVRRRGDVWDRLPPELRASRTYRGLLLVCMFTLFLPLYFIALWEGLPLGDAIFYVMVAALAPLFVLSRRAVRAIAAKSGATSQQASMILSTPSWRTSAWQRPPASLVLAGVRPPASSSATTARAVGRAEEPGADDQVTRM